MGITSTGSGTLVIAALSALYPALAAKRLVGTDLAQAVPMVFAGAAAHLVAGDVHLNVTAPLLIGGVPGVIVGALLASRVPGGVLRPVLSVIILASGLSLLGLSPAVVGVVAAACAVTGAAFAIRRQGRISKAPGRAAGTARDGRRRGLDRPAATDTE